MPHLLIVEDDPLISRMYEKAFSFENYTTDVASNGKEGLEKVKVKKPDLILLDIMMPVKDGFTVARKIRQQSDVIPILFISTKALIEDKVEGYNKGADDYIVKPFNMKELLLKLDVFLRRTKKMFSETKQEFIIGKIHFIYTDLRLTNNDGVFALKQKEADLLKFLCEHPNRILKREEILMAVWGKNDYFLGRSMDVFMSKVRKYLRADPDIVLETIHGTGYRFTVPVA